MIGPAGDAITRCSGRIGAIVSPLRMNDDHRAILIEDLNRTELAGAGWRFGHRAAVGAGATTTNLETAEGQPDRDHLEFRRSVAANPDGGKIARIIVRRIKSMAPRQARSDARPRLRTTARIARFHEHGRPQRPRALPPC